ncbi:TIM-barrel domain-containing protein [Colwellia sp. PAMC 21821]|uniref:glycoside hydrolase family 31 protein n=1 Tax=Colwellia sp. PAMC 21821 TaxID=1816219 RepID=UPI0009BC93BC|nr:TIM-barrel domain-containing protein [Colwellia sp. PAMC 21821]ARD42907.1 glycosyl hydrolase [Colwellia sp. PAMC 21821]
MMQKYLFKAKTVMLMPVLSLIALMLLTISWQGEARDYVAHQLSGNTLVINTDDGMVEINALNPSAFEVHYQPIGFKQLPSFAIDKNSTKQNKYDETLTVVDSKKQLMLSSKTLVAIINKSPFSIRYTKPNGDYIAAEELGFFTQQPQIVEPKVEEIDKAIIDTSTLAVDNEVVEVADVNETQPIEFTLGFRFKLQPQEKILGGGQRVLGMDRRGQKMPLYNRAHYGYETESSQMYYGLSAVMSSNKYIIVFDNSANGELDIAHDEADILQFSAIGGRTSYLIIAGDSYPKLIENLVDVTGKQPLPPRWSLGNIASRFGYHSEQEARAVVQKYHDEDFPLDAIVFDLYWFGPDIKGHMGNLNWDTKAFPTPVDMIKDFKAEGVNTIMITEPFILTSSSQWQSAVENSALMKNALGQPEKFDFYFGNTGLVDVFDEKSQDWFWQYYQQLAEQGVAGWWGDLGEPEVHPANGLHSLDGANVTGDEVHNAYGHKWAEMVFKRLQKFQPETRPFILMRSGFIGSQRYGMVPWTGDVSRSWGGFKPQVELALQMSVLGLSYIHSDLGGFAGDGPIDKELYIRWLQYGVFQPVYRPHAQENAKPEPIFHDTKTKDILREYVKLRYQLMPYIYSLSIENSLTGMPIMRPMFFEDETKLSMIDEKDSYFYGDALLVAPVTEQGARRVEMNLPTGVWFNFWNDQRYLGNQKTTIAAPLNQTPVLVRGGAFIPMVEAVQSTKDYNTKNLTLHYYADASVKSSSAVMYNDDGKDPNSLANGDYETLTFNATQQDKNLSINLRQAGDFSGIPASRQVSVVIHHYANTPVKIKVNNKAIKLVANQQQLTDHTFAAWYDSNTKQLKIKADWNKTVNIAIN